MPKKIPGCSESGPWLTMNRGRSWEEDPVQRSPKPRCLTGTATSQEPVGHPVRFRWLANSTGR